MTIKWMSIAVVGALTALALYASIKPISVLPSYRNTAEILEDPVGDPDNLLPHVTIDPLIKVDDDPKNDRIGRKPASAQ